MSKSRGNARRQIAEQLQSIAVEFGDAWKRTTKPEHRCEAIERLRVQAGRLWRGACAERLIPHDPLGDEIRNWLPLVGGRSLPFTPEENECRAEWMSRAMPLLIKLDPLRFRAAARTHYASRVLTDAAGRVLGKNGRPPECVIVDAHETVRIKGRAKADAFFKAHLDPEKSRRFLEANPAWGNRWAWKLIGPVAKNTDKFDDADWLHFLSEGATDDADGCRALADLIDVHPDNGKAGDGSVTPRVPESRLPESQLEVMKALKVLKAISRDRRRTAAEIAEKARGASDAYLVKEPLASLTRLQLVESLQGRNGGSWLTRKGIAQLRLESKR